MILWKNVLAVLFCVIFLKFNLSLLDWFKQSIIYIIRNMVRVKDKWALKSEIITPLRTQILQKQ